MWFEGEDQQQTPKQTFVQKLQNQLRPSREENNVSKETSISELSAIRKIEREKISKTSFSSNAMNIKVIGLGGGGGQAVTNMVRENIQGAEFIAMNSDIQALAATEAPIKIQRG